MAAPTESQNYDTYDHDEPHKQQQFASQTKRAVVLGVLVVASVASLAIFKFSTAATAVPAAADIATTGSTQGHAMTVSEAEAAALRDFGEVNVDTIEAEATAAKFGKRLSSATSATAPCPGRPAPVVGKKPIDVISDIHQHWKLQLPCEEIDTDSNGISTCEGDYEELLRRSDSPGVHTVNMNDMDDFVLMPEEYGDGFCSGGWYVAKDDDDTEMIAINVPVSGTTTSGSDNPRVELRQMNTNTEMAGFKLYDGNGANVLEVTASIEHVPSVKSSTSVVQVFNAGYDEPGGKFSPKKGGPFIEIITAKCQYSWQKLPDGSRCPVGTVGIGVWKDGKFGGKGGNIFAEYEMGTKFDLKITVPGDGTVAFEYTPEGGETVDFEFECDDLPSGSAECLKYSASSRKSAFGDDDNTMSNGLYFKVGNYVQKAADEDPKDYSLVYLYDYEITKS